MFTNHIVLKPGTLCVCKQNIFGCSISVTIFSVLIWDIFLAVYPTLIIRVQYSDDYGIHGVNFLTYIRSDIQPIAHHFVSVLRSCNYQPLTLYLIYFTGVTQAFQCEVGQEPDPAKNNKMRWVLPYKDPCQCTNIIQGGLNTITPRRPFKPHYIDTPLVTSDISKIRKHYNLDCLSKLFLQNCTSLISNPAGWLLCPAKS